MSEGDRPRGGGLRAMQTRKWEDAPEQPPAARSQLLYDEPFALHVAKAKLGVDDHIAPGRVTPVTPTPPPTPLESFALTGILLGLVALGTVNFVLLKLVYTEFGDVPTSTDTSGTVRGGGHDARTSDLSFFANQGINFLYVVFGGCILYPQMLFNKKYKAFSDAAGVGADEVDVEGAVEKPPQQLLLAPLQTKFVIMGTLDACGTFLTSLGAAGTPGSLQPLLNQTLIPYTMLVSYVTLGSWYTTGEVYGAGMIVLGAALSVFSCSDKTSSSPSEELDFGPIGFYALSTIPMACSAVYKEQAFQKQKIDVWYLTQWVSIYQFVLTFVAVPFHAGFGETMWLGMRCVGLSGGEPARGTAGAKMNSAIGREGGAGGGELEEFCSAHSLAFLLCLYTFINVLFNTLGLYLTKHGSAVLNALAYSILLPMNTLLYFTSLVPSMLQQECSFGSLLVTSTSLLLVLTGFTVFRLFGAEGDFLQFQEPSEVARQAQEVADVEAETARLAEREPAGVWTSIADPMVHTPPPHNRLRRFAQAQAVDPAFFAGVQIDPPQNDHFELDNGLADFFRGHEDGSPARLGVGSGRGRKWAYKSKDSAGNFSAGGGNMNAAADEDDHSPHVSQAAEDGDPVVADRVSRHLERRLENANVNFNGRTDFARLHMVNDQIFTGRAPADFIPFPHQQQGYDRLQRPAAAGAPLPARRIVNANEDDADARSVDTDLVGGVTDPEQQDIDELNHTAGGDRLLHQPARSNDRNTRATRSANSGVLVRPGYNSRNRATAAALAVGEQQRVASVHQLFGAQAHPASVVRDVSSTSASSSSSAHFLADEGGDFLAAGGSASSEVDVRAPPLLSLPVPRPIEVTRALFLRQLRIYMRQQWQDAPKRVCGFLEGCASALWTCSLLKITTRTTSSSRTSAHDAGSADLSHSGEERVALEEVLCHGREILVADLLTGCSEGAAAIFGKKCLAKGRRKAVLFEETQPSFQERLLGGVFPFFRKRPPMKKETSGAWSQHTSPALVAPLLVSNQRTGTSPW